MIAALCLVRLGIGLTSSARPPAVESPEQSPSPAKAGSYPILPTNVEWAETAQFNHRDGNYEVAILTDGSLIEGIDKAVYQLMNDPSESLDKFLVDVKRRYPRLGGARRAIHVSDKYTVRLDWKAYAPKTKALQPCQIQLFILRNMGDKVPIVTYQGVLYGGSQFGLGTFGEGAVSADHHYMVRASFGPSGTTLSVVGVCSTKPKLKMVSDWKATEFLVRPKKLIYDPGLYEKRSDKFADHSASLLDGIYGALGPNSFFGGVWPPILQATPTKVQVGPKGGTVSFGSNFVKVPAEDLGRCFGDGTSFPLNIGVQVQGSEIRIRTLQPPVYASEQTSIAPIR